MKAGETAGADVSRRAFLAMAASTTAAGFAVAQQGGGSTAAITLPALPYAQDALVPVVSAQTVGFHYGKHHAGYVTTLNKLLPGTPFEGKSLEEIIQGSAGKVEFTALFNNAAQIWNHTFYWQSLAPQGGKPSAALAAAINAAFGSLDACKAALADVAMKQFGSGWAWLVAEKGTIKVIKTPNAETPLTQLGVLPLLTIDVWEHAYYLDWQNRRADYAKAILEKVVNWASASERFVAAG